MEKAADSERLPLCTLKWLILADNAEFVGSFSVAAAEAASLAVGRLVLCGSLLITDAATDVAAEEEEGKEGEQETRGQDNGCDLCHWQ